MDPGLAAPLSLTGKTALVTGASRGIGLAIAELFLRAGAAVCISARKQHELDEALASLAAVRRRAGEDSVGRAICHAGSVDDPAAVQACVEHVVAEFGAVDILVNNAATNPVFGPLMDIDLAAWRKTFAVNLDGPLMLCQRVWHASMRERGGVILNIATVGAHQPAPGVGAYTASKAALVHFTRQLAGELAPQVRVLSISPGLVKTRMSSALWEGNEDAAAGMTPLGRLGEPQDIARIALMAASDMACWSTGTDILVDGGALVGAARMG